MIIFLIIYKIDQFGLKVSMDQILNETLAHLVQKIEDIDLGE